MTRPDKPRIASNIAALARVMALLKESERHDILTSAEDMLSDTGETKAAMLVDGMRIGIQQAQDVDAGWRAVTVWFGGKHARATFAWPSGKHPGSYMHRNVMQAVESALKVDGETNESR